MKVVMLYRIADNEHFLVRRRRWELVRHCVTLPPGSPYSHPELSRELRRTKTENQFIVRRQLPNIYRL
ncbi:hypothetical protein SAMN05444359_11198 [Neolewinella agarilytica]|uniref:Uncharacterized protein n=1 Tax=Neolewinella agarilytica TaxID=478744 RepID=A0A1H9GT83_9BACT|nr:hypothetical protein SAMN05444359_11198 [Neolewinella agarilytica]